ncbi:MAG: DNA/RNA helicase domain-containing protein [Vulcanimicrobiaceae bacterium]
MQNSAKSPGDYEDGLLRLYEGSTDDFVGEVTGHRITDRLRSSFYEYYGHQPAFSELRSWQNSLAQMALVVNAANLHDNGIVVELELPSTSSRLDCLLYGLDSAREPVGVLVELKQWQEATSAEPDGCVETFLGKRRRVVPHPSLQAANYAQYLTDSVSTYAGDDAIALQPCSFLHNLDAVSKRELSAPRFRNIIERSPMYVGYEAGRFIADLRTAIGNGAGVELMKRALSGKQRPSKKLLEHTAAVVKGEPRYTLLDEQIVAYETILAAYRRSRRSKTEHAVVVVKGGPGTGKSVIALNLVGTLSQLGVGVSHATGSKAFTETLWKILGNRVKPQFRYFNQFGSIEEAGVDVLICDEAHRIRRTSNSRFTPKNNRSDRGQVDELILAAQTSVFFVDDHQSVRPDEIGSSHLIREAAVASSARYEEIDLRAQFRCAGSETYVEWLDQLFDIRKTGRFMLPQDESFEFDVLTSAEELERRIEAAIGAGYSARMTAGFCWEWSNPDPSGHLKDDIVIGAFRRPWNAKPDAARLTGGIPPAPLWASSPLGAGQVGCIYTAQGFEFDYVGVIVGLDLVRRTGSWKPQPTESRDPAIRRKPVETFGACVKNAYRVLLTRGLRGCFVTFLDPETREFVMQRSGLPLA